MLKTVEDLSPTKKKLHIEIPPEAIREAYQKELQRLRERTKLPGFRPGKAPLGLIEKRFGRSVEGEVLERLIPEYYLKGLKEASLRPVGSPQLLQSSPFSKERPLALTLQVEVLPQVELNYSELQVEAPEVKVSQEDVQAVLKRLQEERATFEPSEEPLAEGDLAVFDYQIEEELSDKELQGQRGQLYRLNPQAEPQEFFEAFQGRKKGEEFTVKAQMPQDHPLKAMRGRELSFSIRITEVKKARLPQLNDEFAKDYGKDDLEGLKEHIRKELERSQHHSIQRLQKAQIVKTLLERHDFEVPQSLLQQELQRLVGEALARGEGQEPEALKEAFREQALRNVKASVLLQLIAEAEGLSVSEEELKGRIQETAQRAGLGMEDVIKYYTARDGSLEGLRQAALEEKTLQWLLQRARKKTPKEDKE